MRTKAATALLGAGAFSLALAGLVPAVVAPALMKAPAGVDKVTHARGEAQKLNTATRELEPITIEATRTLKTALKNEKEFAGNGDTAVYQELTNLAVVGPDGEANTVDARGRYSGLKASAAVVAFDRKTGKGVPGFQGDTFGTTAQTVKFPFGTQKKTYDLYDGTTGKAWPVEYVRTTTIKGLEVYEFSGTIPETSIGQYGVLEGTDTLYSNKGRTLLVEPVTGSIVSSVTSPQTSIRFADGKVSPALLVDELTPTAETLNELVADAKESKSGVEALQKAPWALGGLGVVLLAGGGLLGRRRRSGTGSPARPDVSGLVPGSRTEPALDRSTVRQ